MNAYLKSNHDNVGLFNLNNEQYCYMVVAQKQLSATCGTKIRLSNGDRQTINFQYG